MQAQDPRVVFYTIRPLGDEVWNMVDGQKTIGEIAAACAIEFGVVVDGELFLPIFEGLKSHHLITFTGD
jgi:hypothetical protein